MAVVTLKDVVTQLKSMHKDQKQSASIRQMVRQEAMAQNIGSSYATGVLAGNMLGPTATKVADRTKKIARTAVNFGTLGIAPAVGGIGKAIRTARSNREQKKQIKEEIESRGNTPEKKVVKAITSKGSDSVFGTSDRIADAVERIANSVAELVDSMKSTTQEVVKTTTTTPFGFADRTRKTEDTPSTPETEASSGGDMAASKSRNKMIRFARVQSKIIGRAIGDSTKKTVAASKAGFARMGKAFMGAARFIIMGIVSAIGSLLAAVAPFAAPILAAAAGIGALALLVKKWFDLSNEEDEIRAMEEESERMGKQAIKDFREKDDIKDNSVGTILEMQQAKVNAARESGDKVDLFLPGQGTFKNLSVDAADAMLVQSRELNETEGTMTMSARDLEDQQSMADFEAGKLTPDQMSLDSPMNATDAASFTDTEYFDNEVSRLEALKASGAGTATTVRDGIGLFSPVAVNDLFTEEIDIDSAIALAKTNQAKAKGLHIGMTRKELRRQGLMKGEGALFDMLNKSAEQMREERSSVGEILTHELMAGGAIGGPAGMLVAKAKGAPSLNVGKARDMSTSADLAGRLDTIQTAPDPAAEVTAVNNSKVINNTTNVESGHMIDSPASVKEMQHAG